ncbi:TetR/AcrR family transcriptional regulator [Micromonospora sp. WMMD1102]|uniref:TetR/AcrR family transcriptional regulator n=1 Tax=Micromonospora sp. WMMD1102 TaxID=3016105 RepID=UPI0024153B08|nr:TetR/AcrR family transcriptional regulator [Micromonospora sp. WMMD1102]MDG4790086.1 TetR/AcrR family transcriptional regulator [Micromonospora sp. WMMD1102]
MPKMVDHHERRRLIADALLRVAVRHGFEGVSLRHVATEAGVTSGMVQHYFRTKDEMMQFALGVVRERNEARITEAVSRLGPDPAPRDFLRAVLAGLLPLDDASRADGLVALAFLAYAALRPEAGASLRRDTSQLVAHLADQIRRVRTTDGARADIDPDAAAAGLLAVTEGLGTYLLTAQTTPENALRALDAHLTLVLPTV